MSITITIPHALAHLSQGQTVFKIQVSNIREAIDTLEKQFPGLKERFLDEKNTLRDYINIYVNGEDISFLDDLGTPLKDGDVVNIIPALAGG